MLTLDNLRAYGANVDEGLARCVGMEALYIKLVSSIFKEPAFDRLAEGIHAGNLDEAFEAAHALKGVLGNLSLTPLYEPMSELTEKLRARKEGDYEPALQEILEKKAELEALL